MRIAAKRELQRAESPVVTGAGAAEVEVEPLTKAVLKAALTGLREVASHIQE
jgi:hypothetical protein